MVIKVFLASDLLSIEDQELLFFQLKSHRYISKGLVCDKLGSYEVQRELVIVLKLNLIFIKFFEK